MVVVIEIVTEVIGNIAQVSSDQSVLQLVLKVKHHYSMQRCFSQFSVEKFCSIFDRMVIEKYTLAV